MKKCFIFS